MTAFSFFILLSIFNLAILWQIALSRTISQSQKEALMAKVLKVVFNNSDIENEIILIGATKAIQLPDGYSTAAGSSK